MHTASRPESTRFRFTPRIWLVWLAFFLIVAGVRLWLVANFGSAIPLQDQWDDEAARILKPYAEGTLGAAQLFASHNEHRPVIARLLALVLFILNGQWDARLQMVANTFVAASVAVIIAAIAVRLIGAARRNVVLVAVGALACLPYSWENTTWGFQSSFYFLALFSVVAIWGLVAHPPFSRAWIVGALAAVLACVSMGSGFLCAAAVLAIVLPRALIHREAARLWVPTTACGLGVIILGFALRTHVPAHDVFRAASIGEWLASFTRSLAWPFARQPALSAIIYAPSVALALFCFVRTKRAVPRVNAVHAQTILALTAWVVLQAAAIAYARGGGVTGSYVASRYMGILAVGALANLLALFVVTALPTLSERWTTVARIAGAGWIALVFVGAVALGYRGAGEMQHRAAQTREAERTLRSYVATAGGGDLGSEAVRTVYPWPDRFGLLLRDATIRSFLPAVIRAPLRLDADGTTGPFTRSGDVWNSHTPGARSSAEMRSRIVQPSLPYLRLEMRGALGKGISLKLRDENTGKMQAIEFRRGRDWRIGFAAVSGPVRVIARDENAERALEFTEPREAGRFSVYAEILLAESLYIVIAGLTIVVALSVYDRVGPQPTS